MTDNPADLRASELLAAMGTVQSPEPRILENAREVLWSAVTTEMLGTGPECDETTATTHDRGTSSVNGADQVP
jgi:hypothetical protein